jgi:hypothetical protein
MTILHCITSNNVNTSTVFENKVNLHQILCSPNYYDVFNSSSKNNQTKTKAIKKCNLINCYFTIKLQTLLTFPS